MNAAGEITVALEWAVRCAAAMVIVAGLAVALWRRRKRNVVRSFFGNDSVTAYFPSTTLDGNTTIAEADFAAAHKLSSFLATFDIDVQFKFISPDSRIDPDDKGVIAICGPKSSDTIARAFERDDAVRFQQHGNGYVLMDLRKGQVYRSRRNVEGSDSDIGYLARNYFGPGTTNTFISIAGVHAEGSAIVVSHLCDFDTLKTLHRKTKKSPFSSVIGGEYRPDPLTVISSHLLTLHRRSATPANASDFAIIEDRQKAPKKPPTPQPKRASAPQPKKTSAPQPKKNVPTPKKTNRRPASSKPETKEKKPEPKEKKPELKEKL